VQHNCHAILLAQANALALVHCIQNAEVDLFFVLKAETRQKNILGHGNAFKTAPETHSKYLADKTVSERDFCAKC